MNLNPQSIRGLVGFGIVILIFVVLKLAGILTWPWLWVLSPLWVAALLGVLFLLVLGVMALLSGKK